MQFPGLIRWAHRFPLPKTSVVPNPGGCGTSSPFQSGDSNGETPNSPQQPLPLQRCIKGELLPSGMGRAAPLEHVRGAKALFVAAAKCILMGLTCCWRQQRPGGATCRLALLGDALHANTASICSLETVSCHGAGGERREGALKS